MHLCNIHKSLTASKVPTHSTQTMNVVTNERKRTQWKESEKSLCVYD